jgi:hypothetical protein
MENRRKFRMYEEEVQIRANNLLQATAKMCAND